jgi:NAD-dependent deacetylase
LVQRASRAVAFTGAGISTECGIPDFRSPGGFWTRHKPIEFGEFMRSEAARLEAWRRYLTLRDRFAGVVPGPGHRAVAELVRRGHVRSVITQNIDGLHGRSGIAADRIIEIHGNGTFARCLTCETRYELDRARAEIAATDAAPVCDACGGIVKPATISFGQPMPQQAMADARAATLDADLFLVVGSSLQVFPAAGLPVMAAHNRTPLVIVNREPTGLDGLAALVINGEIGEVLTAVVEIAGQTESMAGKNQISPRRTPA